MRTNLSGLVNKNIRAFVAKQVTYIILFLIAFSTNAQDSLSELLNTYNTKTVPYISSQELAMPKTKAIILDAREQKEFEVSHLKDAIFVGYNTFDLEQTISQLNNKQQTIVVYCSLGIRSEAIAEKLKRAGYTNVFNLYGGIFEWKNEDFPILDSKGKETDSVHTFSKSWSKWLSKGVKVYD